MFMFQEQNESNVKAGNVDQSAAEEAGIIQGKAFTDIVYKNLVSENGLAGLGTDIGTEIANAFSLKATYIRAGYLDKQQAEIRATLGLGSQKADEFKKLVADGAANFAKIGLKVDDVGKTYGSLLKTFQADIAIADEDLLELGATSKVTGQEVGALAQGFRGVGISIQEVGERMTEVAQIAREAGVSVAAVSAGVVKNLDKMNIYNFENGTKGLAKMAAQASRLGIDMDKIFAVVDKAFNPESAIEMAAAMQRLGVSTGALLDPLRLMDLSQNDPTELQNQIVNMTKDFVRFNEELGQFEIMPGEKRRLQEIGKELGMTSGELQKMAINAAGLDMKMKQIRFPSSIASKEDRELIATLATVNKQGVAQVKVARLDEKGERTGEFDMIDVGELTNEQLETIKKEQDLRGQTMEEIAIDQLSELDKLNTQFDSVRQALVFGIATSKPVNESYKAATTGLRQSLFGGYDLGLSSERKEGLTPEMVQKTQTYRRFADNLKLEDLEKLGTAIKDDFSGMISSITNVDWSTITSNASSFFETIKNSVNTIIPSINPFGGSESDPLSNFKDVGEMPKLELDEKVNVDINVKLDPNIQNQALSQIIQTEIEKWFSENNLSNGGIVHKILENFKTNSGLTTK